MLRACIWNGIVCYRSKPFNKTPAQKGCWLQEFLPMQKHLRTSGALPLSRTLFLRKHLGPRASACKATVAGPPRTPTRFPQRRFPRSPQTTAARGRRPPAVSPPLAEKAARWQWQLPPHGDSAFPRAPRCLRMAPSGSPKIRQSGDPKARRSKGRSNAWGGAGFMKLYR